MKISKRGIESKKKMKSAVLYIHGKGGSAASTLFIISIFRKGDYQLFAVRINHKICILTFYAKKEKSLKPYCLAEFDMLVISASKNISSKFL